LPAKTCSRSETYIYTLNQRMSEAVNVPVERPKSIFEPAMITSVDHLKKDDLQFDLEAEIAKAKKQKQPDSLSAPTSPKVGRELQ